MLPTPALVLAARLAHTGKRILAAPPTTSTNAKLPGLRRYPMLAAYDAQHRAMHSLPSSTTQAVNHLLATMFAELSTNNPTIATLGALLLMSISLMWWNDCEFREGDISSVAWDISPETKETPLTSPTISAFAPHPWILNPPPQPTTSIHRPLLTICSWLRKLKADDVGVGMVLATLIPEDECVGRRHTWVVRDGEAFGGAMARKA
ncbi:hypothetical protein F5887DRAFT_919196 [Amanita rubescens]|nr:hypothetical protein F5887DRAFT_919196 [Amanita rubescens]